jgi:3-oxoacyl-[acyl-carrier protein] reductase
MTSSEAMDEVIRGMPPAGLRGKIAIVTGASRRQSIAAAVCRAFASCGVDLLFTYWRPCDRLTWYADEEGLAVISS